nr:MAG TPA: hypothetical protein [Caudoviricetes sp.]
MANKVGRTPPRQCEALQAPPAPCCQLPAIPSPMFYGERGTVCVRFCPQMRPYLPPAAFVSAPRFARVWEQLRPCLGADALVSPPRCAEKNRECGA